MSKPSRGKGKQILNLYEDIIIIIGTDDRKLLQQTLGCTDHRLHNQGRTNLEQLADLQHLREPQLIPLQSELVSYFM